MLDLLGTNEQGTVVRRSIFSGQKGVAGSSACGCLYVMPVKRSSLLGQTVDVGRMHIVRTEGIQFRPQVINANQEDVWLV